MSKIYKDNPMNRRLNRVGKPYGYVTSSTTKECPEGKILNPKSKRCVSENGKIGKALLKSLRTPQTPKPKVNQNNHFKIFKQGQAEVDIYQKFYDKKEADYILKELSKIKFEDSYVKIYGKRKMPRKMLWFSDNKDWSYVFSKNHINGLKAHKFTKLLNKIREKVEKETKQEFNSLLINYYESGQNSVNWHNDDDPWLGENFMVPSLSFGGERNFLIKENKKGSKSEKILLKHGSMIVMKEMTQKSHIHSVPKTKQNIGPRINLTFRNVKQELVSKQPKPAEE